MMQMLIDYGRRDTAAADNLAFDLAISREAAMALVQRQPSERRAPGPSVMRLKLGALLIGAGRRIGGSRLAEAAGS